MSNRLAQDPINQFAAIIRKARQDLDALKTAQISGSDSNRVYLLETSATWDYYVDAVAPGGSAAFTFSLDFEHQKYGYGVVIAKIYLDVVDDAHLVQVGDVGARDFFSAPTPPATGSEGKISWTLGVYYNDDTATHRYYYKLYYLATDILT